MYISVSFVILFFVGFCIAPHIPTILRVLFSEEILHCLLAIFVTVAFCFLLVAWALS